MRHLDPGNARVPSIKLGYKRIEQVVDDAVTCLLFHHGTISWHGEIAPGFDFFLWTTRRAKYGTDRIAARVRTLRVCPHPDVYSIRDCPAGHRPEAVWPGKRGWRRIWDAAVLTGESGKLEAGRWSEKFGEPWSVVDFEFVGSSNREAPRQRSYRNQVEAELSEQSRRLEAARLAAEAAGEAHRISEAERRFRATSAAYNRKLSKAFEYGHDTAVLTVTEAEIEVELSRMRR